MLDTQKQLQFSKLFLIYKMVHEYPINALLEGDDKYLESVLEQLSAQGHLSLDTHYYQVTPLGREGYGQFMKRYVDFLANFDVYCAVDLAKGEFAFEQFWKMEDEEWKRYLNQEQFEDLRVAVARFKGLDPAEIVFMSFLNEDRFDQATAKVGWQFDLSSGRLWHGIDEITASSIQEKDLGYQDERGKVPGSTVLADIIESGALLNQTLWKDGADSFKEEYDGLEIDEEALKAYSNRDYLNPIWKKGIF